MDPTKKIIQWVKNMHNFRIFFLLDHNLCEPHTFEKKEMIVLGGKKIISGKISTVGLTQMNFNRR